MTRKILKSLTTGNLEIGKITIPCAVLETEIRVISQRGIETALTVGNVSTKSDNFTVPGFPYKLPTFLRFSPLKPYIKEHLQLAQNFIIEYVPPHGGKPALGLPASLLPVICDIWITANKEGVLTKTQQRIATRAYVLLKGFAHVGIIALVDEATGYQDLRSKRALADLLEKYLEKEYHEWTKTFSLEFYIQMFRLKNWDFGLLAEGKHPPMPSLVGKITKQIIYKRLPPGVLEELEKRNPKNEKGNRQVKHHQWFNPEYGHPKLKEHIASVIALMRASNNWVSFERSLKRAFPISGEQTELDV